MSELHARFILFLGWVLLPMWLAAGVGDWLCHRRTHIEHTSGARESAMHVLLFGLIAVPLALALFFTVNALLLAFIAAGVAAHTACSWWDTAYTQPKRHIAPFEQMIHSHLEMLPFFGFTIVLLLYWDALPAPEWKLVPRVVSLPRPVVVTVLAALLLGLSFIGEEFLRCVRAARIMGAPRR